LKGFVGTVKPSYHVPTVENIHTKIYKAVTADPKYFDMSTWHRQTSCGTTHCRAGWVIELAGEAGKSLEAFHDTPLAAFLIYNASSPHKVSMPRFYEGNEDALADMKRLAELESKID
jgi:hypothetical protein